jgi:hypothetical protein
MQHLCTAAAAAAAAVTLHRQVVRSMPLLESLSLAAAAARGLWPDPQQVSNHTSRCGVQQQTCAK